MNLLRRNPEEPDDDLSSPLAGIGLPKALVKIVVAIAVPGGIYALAALVVAPLLVRFMLRRARTRIEEGRPADSLVLLTWALRLSRGSAAAHTQRGLAHFALNDLDAALKDAESALKKRPGWPLAHYLRGAVVDAQGNAQQARVEYRQFLADFQGDNQYVDRARERLQALGGALELDPGHQTS